MIKIPDTVDMRDFYIKLINERIQYLTAEQLTAVSSYIIEVEPCIICQHLPSRKKRNCACSSCLTLETCAKAN